MQTDKKMITFDSIQNTVVTTTDALKAVEQQNQLEHDRIKQILSMHDECLDYLHIHIPELEIENNDHHRKFEETISILQQEVKWLKMVETSLIASVLLLLALIVIAYV